MAEACEECTNNCLTMHKKHNNPASVVTTFVKVMIGDNYSKTLFLPPNFACRAKKLVGKKTSLEDLNGEKWDVKVAKIDNRLAFEEGWDNFAVKHGLQKGDILVFHYIMKSHFVVLMYGATGCPELRHFGFSHQLMKESKKSDNNVIENGQSSSKVHTNCNNLSHESSSKSEPVAHGVNSIMQTMDKKKLNESKMSPNENTQQLIASSSQPVDKENDQRSELLVENALPDYIFPESPTTVKPCLGDNDNGDEQNECRKNSLQPVVVVESDGGQKSIVVASGGGSDETEVNRIQNSVESKGCPKNNVASSGDSDDVGSNRILKSVEPNYGQKNNVTASGHVDVTETNRMRKSVESDCGQKSGGGSAESEINRIRYQELFEEKMKKATEKRKQSTMHKRPRPDDVPIPPAKTAKWEPVSKVPNSGDLS